MARVIRIKIENIGNLESLEIQPGALTVLNGRNAAGKSSVLAAIKDVLSGGSDPSLIRQGSEKGEVIITLEDGVELRKVITPAKSILTVKHPVYGKVSKSQAYVDKIVDSLSLDPIQFLTSKPSDRVNILLEALPMRVTAEQLGFLPVDILRHQNLDKHALEILSAIRAELYDARTGVNRAAKEKRATANQMTETLPAEPEEGDWAEQLKKTTEALRDLRAGTSNEVMAVKGNFAKAIQEQRNKFANAKEQIQKALNDEIEALRIKSAAWISKVEVLRDTEIKATETSRDAELGNLEAQYRPKEAGLRDQQANAAAMLEQHTKAKATRDLIGRLGTEATILEETSENITEQMKQLEALKSSQLANLGIPGVEISDGQVLVNGIPFERVNTAEQYRVAIEIGKKRSGDLGLLLVDRAEILDAQHWEQFKQAAAAGGVQIVAARVTEGDLTVSTDGEGGTE